MMVPLQLPNYDPEVTLAGMRMIRLAIAQQESLDLHYTFKDLNKFETCRVNAIGALIRQLGPAEQAECVEALKKRCPADRRRLNNTVQLRCRYSMRDPDMSLIRHHLARHFCVPDWEIDEVERISDSLLYVSYPNIRYNPHARLLAFLKRYDEHIRHFREHIHAKRKGH